MAEKTMTENRTANGTAASSETAGIVNQTAAVGVFGNVALSAFKLFAGIFGHSAAMVSDAVHSLSDVFATLIAFVGRKISEKPADREHPYGHERFECIASVILGAILIATGVKIGLGCIEAILDRSYLTAAQPGVIALVAALVSIAVKEAMFWYTMRQAKKLNSSVFKADAWHHRSDALSSIGALVGIAAARLGFPVMDSVAGLVISVVILVVAVKIILGAVNNTLDRSADPETENSIRSAIGEYAGEAGIDLTIDSLITRQFGDKIYVDLEIGVDGDLILKDAHDIAENVHEVIERNFENVKHVMVHLNPNGYDYTVRG
ncbi:MAG: cation transporter [Lachnospiraceae bacterium]|nr:cation transporter [Lachnospiraceae bacterium]